MPKSHRRYAPEFRRQMVVWEGWHREVSPYLDQLANKFCDDPLLCLVT